MVTRSATVCMNSARFEFSFVGNELVDSFQFRAQSCILAAAGLSGTVKMPTKARCDDHRGKSESIVDQLN